MGHHSCLAGMFCADSRWFHHPPISISSAIEGLLILNPEIQPIPIVVIILTALFVFQQFGTKVVGAVFGPS